MTAAISLVCPADFSTTRAISKTHRKILCHNKELNCKTVFLGCVYLGQRQGREEEGYKRNKNKEQEGWGGKILALVQLPGSTG